jgi:hypothetical protein
MNTIRLCLAMILVLGTASVHAAAPGTQVVAQDLQKLRVPGKISAVVWTRRDESCTLQVVLQMPVDYQVAMKVHAQRQAREMASKQPATPQLPQVQAWLLKADGTHIARSPGSPAFPAVARASDGVPLEVKYSFPLAAAQEGVAVAIMVDGEYSIESLKAPGKDGK